MIKTEGLRFNEGKLRYDLVPAFAQQEYVKVLTAGSLKYAERNWEKGMLWSNVIASLKRHLAAIELGEDYDKETGLLHSSHIMCNAAFLTEYYKIFPQGDDRSLPYLKDIKIGLDIDEVLCSWVEAWTQKFGYPIPDSWHFSYKNKEHFESMSSQEMNDFYLSIPAKISPKELNFEPHCYITSRSVPIELTQQWLQNNGFPAVKVYSVGIHKSKVDVAKESGIDIFVDDAYHNFIELNKAGICTYLLSAPHNIKYSVGHKRINSLKDLSIKLGLI
jgi:hypothetical protein